MGDTRRWHERIDAYRSGDEGGDFVELEKQLARHADLRGVAQRAQEWDASLGEAMMDVAVPAELADRLWAGIEASAAEPVAECKSGIDSEAMTAGVNDRGVNRKSRRGVWMGLSGLLAVAAAWIAVVLGWGVGQEEPLTAWDLAESAPGWTVRLPQEKWKLISQHRSVELPPSVSKGILARWQAIQRPNWLVYQLATGPSDYLFVLPGDVAQVYATSPPVRPNLSNAGTGGVAGQCVAVWKNRDRVYVLVLQGGEERYRSLVPPRPTPIARASRDSVRTT